MPSLKAETTTLMKGLNNFRVSTVHVVDDENIDDTDSELTNEEEILDSFQVLSDEGQVQSSI